AVTDANVMAGKLMPDFFPKIFGPNQDQPLDEGAVRHAFNNLAQKVNIRQSREIKAEEIADGFIKIAVENMANAIKKISVQRGYDVTRYALNCFGGAGGQHACLVADALGMKRIYIHPLAGVLSAYGMGLADLRLLKEAAVEARLEPALLPSLDAALDRLAAAGSAEMRAQAPSARVRVARKCHVKYEGTDSPLLVDHGDIEAIRSEFAEAHRQRFGFVMPEKPLVIEAVSAEIVGETDAADEPLLDAPADPPPPQPVARVDVFADGARHEAPVFDRDTLLPGQAVAGPAIITEATATTVVEPGWRARFDRRRYLVLERVAPAPRRLAVGTDVDPVMLEVFSNLFMAIAEQIGVALQNTAYSVNIKERLDFSCALFDRAGSLIANAPHLPVHLGSMGESVRTVIRSRGAERDGRGMRRGDVYVLNAPYNGGTHLPDVTVIMPVFGADPGDARVHFYVASRGHQADIGGTTPGSMPPDSRSVEEEGVLIDDFLLVDAGRFRERETVALLSSGRYPSRDPQQNVADLKAQIAACAKGADELHRMVAHFGRPVVDAYMRHVQANAAEQVRRAIDRLRDGSFAYEMDDGGVIRVKIAIDRTRRRASIDFTGTSPERPTNFNAPSAVCHAAVLYVFRTLVEDEIPLNGGCLEPLDIIIPEGSMLKPRYPAAVVGGNVETSQCITAALYGALGAMAGAQGTMNNFTFGNARHQYYETICGGSGAGPCFDGADAVHTHMTNTRLTDAEVLEWRFPVLLEEFAIRRGSGGKGRWHGGNGVVRRIRFREAMTAAILSGRRRIPPFGLAGGEPGACGRNWVERTDGGREEFGGTHKVEMRAGDVFVIETPGGGG
ncbi:MAG: hydantoinase B/oxoprolinase family protein, partial [Stellaceae bacterium]